MKMEYDLEERTARFSEASIDFGRRIKKDPVALPLITQFVRAATSIGANYTEAINASSKKDFRNKICICKKEAQETKYWLRLLKNFDGVDEKVQSELSKEAQQLVFIFQKIISSCDKKIGI